MNNHCNNAHTANQQSTHSHLCCLIGSSLGPHAEPVLPSPHIDNNTADLVPLCELLPYACHHLQHTGSCCPKCGAANIVMPRDRSSCMNGGTWMYECLGRPACVTIPKFQPRTCKRFQPRFTWFPYRIEPVGVHCLLGVGALWYKHCPFASMLTAWVLPLWFYTFLEQVEVCSR